MRPTRVLILVAVGLGPSLLTLRANESIRTAAVVETERSRLPYVPGEVIVQFSGDGEPALVERSIRDAGGVRARRSAFGGSRYLVSLDSGVDVPDAVDRFRSMPEVDYAEPNGTIRAFFTPNDRLFRFQWHMRMVGAERTWDIQRGAPSVVVAVVDSGIAYEDFGPFRKAPDWGGTVFVQGFNTFTGDSHANDDNFHGTHVASTIAEATNNGEGVAGLAFNCALMPVKVLDAEGTGSFFGVAEGIRYATSFTLGGQRPVKVINLSLGGEGRPSETITQEVNRAVAAGIVVVAAAGNENRPSMDFPASLPNVISVGALDGRRQRAPYSNFGSRLDVVAPGGDLRRDDDGDGRPDGVLQQSFDPRTAAREGRYDDFAYFFVSGTSQATPHVSALAALLVRQGITSPTAVKAAIESTAEDLGPPGRDDTFGHGLIRPAMALRGLGLNQ